MSFTGTCTLPEHAPNTGKAKDLERFSTSARLHDHPGGFASVDARTLTFTDPDAWHAHVKACKGHKLTYTGTSEGVRGLAYKGKPVASTRYRPFTPELGEVGSWVTMSDGTTGQVWAPISGGKSPRVWVATGTEYRDESVRYLSPATDPAEQLTITPEPEPSPELEPVLAAAIDSGRAQIIHVTDPALKIDPTKPAYVERVSPRKLAPSERKAAWEAFEPTPDPEPSPEPVKPKRMAPSERKAWNRAVADLAREHDAYREAMAAWDAFTAQRLAGVSPEDAYAAVMSPDTSNVTPIRSA